jgi:type I restriction enzyme M protein
MIDGAERSGITKDVLLGEIRDAGYQLQPGRYVVSIDQLNAEKALAGMYRVALGDLVETIRPVVYKATEGPTIEVREVSIGDLKQGVFINNPDKLVEVDASLDDKIARQALKPFDIIVTIKGTVGRVGLVPDTAATSGSPWVLGQSSIALRIKDRSKLDPRVLFTFLRSDLGQELLKGIVSGAAIPLIQLRELLALAVPVPAQEVAEGFIDNFDRQARIQAEIDRLVQEQTQLSAALWA